MLACDALLLKREKVVHVGTLSAKLTTTTRNSLHVGLQCATPRNGTDFARGANGAKPLQVVRTYAHVG